MDKLPAELLERIFLLACTDGGRTGRSLALTSKFIHAVSRTSRFHTIALALGSPSQVVQFVACFNAECALSKEAKIRVRHLCLGSAQQQAFPSSPENKEHQLTTPDNASSTAETVPTPSSRDDDFRKEQLTALRKETQRYYRDMMVVLQLLAPDLYTLCILDPEWPSKGFLNLPTILCTGFPVLVELVFVGREPVLHRVASSTDANTDTDEAFFPMLHTLHRMNLPRSPLIHRASNPATGRWRDRAPRLGKECGCYLSGVHEVDMAELRERAGRELRNRVSPGMAELLGASTALPGLPRRRTLSAFSVSSEPNQ